MMHVLVALLLSISSWAAISSKRLAAEQEILYNSLAANDPLRPNMALHLADLLFDASTEVEKGAKFGPQEAKQMESFRLKAIQLYEKSYAGLPGFSAPPKLARLRIQFQLARLYMDQGLTGRADKLWEELTQQKEEPRLRREAALRRAEKLELSSDTKNLSEAKRYYEIALPLCGTPNLCSYIHYRRAWTLYRIGDADAALKDLMVALEKAEPSSFGEILKDTLLFVSHASLSPEKSVTLIENLAEKYERPDLLEKLAEAFYSSDKRAHYVYAIEYINKKSPRADLLISSLEFHYSNRSVSAMKNAMEQLHETETFTSEAKKIEAEKILYRLVVQWDGEVAPEYKVFFNDGVHLYIRLYPRGPQFDKITEGWLAAETNANRKMEQLEAWSEQQKELGNTNQEIRLHKFRLALATKERMTETVVAESALLAVLIPDTAGNAAEKRDLQYQQARALYEQKKYDEALVLFLPLSRPGKEKPDKTATFSQNLSLDILAQQKRYDDVMRQARLWTANTQLQSLAKADATLNQELVEMHSIAEKALFEKSSLLASRDSLQTFLKFCEAGKFVPLSCENAKTLAIQLKDQVALIAILRIQNKKEELTTELEFGGYFDQAAQLLEPGLSLPQATLDDHLRVSMLYEIDGNYKNRDRILKNTIAFVQKVKTPFDSAHENVFYMTLRDAGMISATLLNLPWSDSKKLEIANDLEVSHKGNSQTFALLKSSCTAGSKAWEDIHLDGLKSLYQKQQQIKFIGKRSEQNFNLRIKALKNLSESANCYVKGANTEKRYATMKAVARAYQEMATEIRSAPIPAGIDDVEILAQVKFQIEEAAQPFQTQSQDWNSKATFYLTQLPEEQRGSTEQRYANWEFQKTPASIAKATPPTFNWAPLLEDMKKNPFDASKLVQLQTHFASHGQNRLAAYFQGRLNSDESRKE